MTTASAIGALTSAIAGRYRVDREIGSGGMATVYLAQDVKHDRRVAVKVLHPDLAATLGAERFLAEIKTTANLQHPHILPLHDSGEADGFLFYVMPYVDGESLRERLTRERQLPIDETIRLSQQIASALDYAHRHSVVHRDIKPENILLHEGSALVADFGIALAVQSAGGQRMTQTGLSLGTPQYMSPEQAMGDKNIDARSDIYSLAAVTYEMLAGEPPFTGATVQAIVAKVLTAEPEPITMTRRNVSAATAAALRRGLEKVPADRFATAAEFSAALTRADVSPSASSEVHASSSRSSSPKRSVAVAAAAVILGVGAFALGRVTQPQASGSDEPIMATLVPEGGELWSTNGGRFAVSPDGRRVVVISGDTLLVRSLDSLGSAPLHNTRGADQVFWSPDGRSVGFFADKQLKTINLATGAVRGLCPAARPEGGTWAADGTILFTPDRATGLFRTNTSSGVCEKLNIALPTAALGARPTFFPDGKHFVLTTDLAAYLGELGRDSVTQLTTLPRMRAVFAPPDFLLYEPQGSPNQSIFARRIDVRARSLVGDPVKVLDGVPHNSGNTALSASMNGTLVARVRFTGGATVVGVFTRGGAMVDTQSVFRGGTFGLFRLSHDGRRTATGGFQIDLFDLDRHVDARLIDRTPGRTLFQYPQWSPRDTAIAYIVRDSVSGHLEVVETATGTRRPLAASFPAGRSPVLEDWSSDGRYIAYTLPPGGSATATEGWVYDLSTKQSQHLVDIASAVGSLRIAPNVHSVAYAVDDGVFIRSFPGTGAPIRVSPSTARTPRWRGDSRELFYVDTTGAIMGIPVRDDGQLAGQPQVAVAASAIRAVTQNPNGISFEPSADGKQFYVSYGLTPPRPMLTVLTNWWKHAGLSARR
ncbi:MAG TPA: protein kinase [Gemmatimonadaceae bacterium]